ncbi:MULTISPECIES: hypothetical protein [Bradyrhizobium]|uniref:hypothetical protein n=1 Tax=Bradyrhizobium oropedii TaxID=1571201 RepID=UPI003083F15D
MNYAGKVHHGFDRDSAANLQKRLTARTQKKAPVTHQGRRGILAVVIWEIRCFTGQGLVSFSKGCPSRLLSTILTLPV